MTQEEYNKKLKEIMAQEEKYGVKISMDPIDKDHLDCTWYGGEVGIILYRGYTFCITAYGDIRLNGYVKGYGEVNIKDKNNSGRVYDELGRFLDDDKLHELVENMDLVYENNNWFEVDLITPDGEFYDLCHCDNVLDDDLLDCFTDVSEYFQYIDVFENERRAILDSFSKDTVVSLRTEPDGRRTITYLGYCFYNAQDNPEHPWHLLSFLNFTVSLEEAIRRGIREAEVEGSSIVGQTIDDLTEEEMYKKYRTIHGHWIKEKDLTMESPDGWYVVRFGEDEEEE